MNEPELFLTDSPDGEACQLIDDRLGDFNAQHAGYWDSRPLAVLVRDPASRQIVGGMLCRTSLGLLFIDLEFLPEELRRHQIGTRMLRMAEEEAARRGCRGVGSSTRSASRRQVFTNAMAGENSAGSLVSRRVHRGFSWPRISVPPWFEVSVENQQSRAYRLAVHWNPQRTFPTFLRPSIAGDGR